MKPTLLLSSALLTLGVALSAPHTLAHVGHGDEFQAEGGINRVEVKTETDSLLGIEVKPIEATANGSGAVLIPVTALVDDNGRQLVFVQYENFYEPVPVTTGATQGDLIEVTEGLSVGEQLVTQGSLSLYAESRKTQTAEATPAATEAAAPAVENVAAPVAAEIEEPAEASTEATDSSGGGFPVGLVAALGGGAALLAGAVVVSGKKKGE